jgi:peptidoglycan/xylan/chitin deacetylase (PgdA/CDA1 family)
VALGCAFVASAVIAALLAESDNGPSPAVRRGVSLGRREKPAGDLGRRRAARPVAAPARNARRSRTTAVPILMYHVIASPMPGTPYPGLYVPVAEFAAQMRAVAAAGYHAITLDQMRSAWFGSGTLPSRPIVISFDNGYRTQYTEALPVLRHLGWVGDENLQLSGLPPSQGGLSERQVRDLVASGWELDTQGYSHADLIRLDAQQLEYQVAAARITIRRLYNVKADWFCYPSGHYNATVIAAVRAAGYIGATSVVPGWARARGDPYRLPRLRVLGGTSPQALLALIAGSRQVRPAPASFPAVG